MGRTLQQVMGGLGPDRRARIASEAERLYGEHLTLQALRKAKDLTQATLAERLGVRQATVAKYERQGDLLLSTLREYIRAMGGELSLVVSLPGQAPVRIGGLADGSDKPPPRPSRRAARGAVAKTPATGRRRAHAP